MATRRFALAGLCFVGLGCMSRSYALPETPDNWRSIVCLAGPNVSRTVHGDSTGTEGVVWVDRAGTRFEIRWPAGFTARFSPTVEVVAPSGKVVVKEGEDLDAVADAGYVVTCPSNGTYGVLS